MRMLSPEWKTEMLRQCREKAHRNRRKLMQRLRSRESDGEDGGDGAWCVLQGDECDADAERALARAAMREDLRFEIARQVCVALCCARRSRGLVSPCD